MDAQGTTSAFIAPRPRERLACHGAPVLGDDELLALIIGEGLAGRPALELARDLLVEAGGVKGLHDCPLPHLVALRGIGPAKAARIAAAAELARRMTARRPDEGTRLRSSVQVWEWFGPLLAGKRKEEFWSVFLDAANRRLGEEMVSMGSQSQTVVHPREAFRSAVRKAAAGVIFVHNHPGGSAEPSPEDRALTARLCRAGQVLGIPVLDHVIIAENAYYSFADRRELG